MRRQLYRGGGITRQRYGLGDLVKKVGERVRKLIPNEIADVAVKAAPFVAPFNPIAAGLMRGVGRYDQRGSLSDALKQGIATYGLGQGARYLGGAGTQGLPKMMGGQGIGGSYGFSTPIGTETGFKMGAWGGATEPAVFKSGPYQNVHQTGAITQTPGNILTKTSSAATTPSDQSWLNKVLFGKEGGTGKIFGDKGLIGAKGKFDMSEAFGKGIPAVFAGGTLASLAVQKAMGDVGEREPGESLEAFNKRRKGTVGQYLDFYFRRANKFRIAPEEMDAAAAKFVADNTKEYVSHGGRIGLQTGGIPTPYDVSAYEKSGEFTEGDLDFLRWNLIPTSSPSWYDQEIAKQRQHWDPTWGPFTHDKWQDMSDIHKVHVMRETGPYQRFGTGPSGPVPSATIVYPPTGTTTTPTTSGGGLGSIIKKAMTTTTTQPASTGISMGNTLAQNIAANQAQAAANQKILQAARARIKPATGGRVGLRFGTPEEGIKSLDAGAPDITYEGDEGPQAPQEEQQMADALLREEYDKYVYDLLEIRPEATPMSFEEFRQMVIAEGKMSGGQPLPEDPTKPINPFAPKPTGPVLPNKMMAAQGGRIGYDVGSNSIDFKVEKELKDKAPGSYELFGGGALSPLHHMLRYLTKKRMEKEEKKNRTKQLYGTGPQGLPGIPRRAPDGMEFDMRQNGGFQGLGAKEGKDDVPAMLAKNEFVFTADAVRGAGGGDIELGAQRMYDTMKNLEKRVV